MIKVKPNTGLRIRDPERHDYLEEEGRDVNEDHYWMRRLRDGDVVIVPKVKIITKKKSSDEESASQITAPTAPGE